MGTSFNALLGATFVLLALFLTFLMFYLWKYPFDHEKHKSSAPRWLMNLHRLLGYLFVAIYIFLMWEMIPRLWSYQIELPARTVVHLSLGLTIGAILIVKIMVVRFFKHMESQLAPLLGTSLLICTLLLMGLALPYSAREAYLRFTAQDGQNFSKLRIERVQTYLPKLGFNDKASLAELASSHGLAEGRTVLTKKCTQCHDLRTILIKPKTPESWQKTVARMSNRSTILNPINESEQWKVIAYLIAISPTLREVASQRRALKKKNDESKNAVNQAAIKDVKEIDLTAAKGVFDLKCAQCHEASLVDDSTLENREQVVSLVSRMVTNGLTGSDEELSQIIAYLAKRFDVSAKGNQPAAPTDSQKKEETQPDDSYGYD